MKIRANQLSSHLKNSLAPCYLVTGDEHPVTFGDRERGQLLDHVGGREVVVVGQGQVADGRHPRRGGVPVGRLTSRGPALVGRVLCGRAARGPGVARPCVGGC